MYRRHQSKTTIENLIEKFKNKCNIIYLATKFIESLKQHVKAVKKMSYVTKSYDSYKRT